MRTILLLLFAFVAIETRVIQEKCQVSINYRKGDLKDPQPLVLKDTDKPTFLLPNGKKLLVIPANKTVVLACPGKKNNLQNFNTSQSIKAVCLKDKRFLVDSKIYEFSQFICKTLPNDVVKKVTSPCLKDHQKYEIGYQLGKNFLPLLEICRHEESYTNSYTKFTLLREIESGQTSFPRASWRYGSYFQPYRMNDLYKLTSQLCTFEQLLGSKELAEKYVHKNKQYLNRGHLASKADFIYGTQQSATFWLLNAAPQWSSFNSGNWLRVENAVRRYAMERQVELDVYTGVHGLSILKDVEGRERELYLYANGTKRALGVPRFFWKILQERQSGKAVAFVGLNEPYAEEVREDMRLCPDIAKEETHSWIGWEPENIKLGLSYICSVEDLRKAVPTVPEIGETGVITLT